MTDISKPRYISQTTREALQAPEGVSRARLAKEDSFGNGFSYLDETFANPRDIRPLNQLGHTRVKQTFHIFKNRVHDISKSDAGFIVAPQWYKSEKEYSLFPLKPRQQQAMMAGQGFFPVPQNARLILPEDRPGVDSVARSVYVRGFHMDASEVRDLIEEQYWPKETKERPRVVGTVKAWLKRMQSSFVGGKFATEAIWLPKGEMYADENRISCPAEARKIWDEVVNPKFASQGSAGGFGPGPYTFETEELRQKYQPGVPPPMDRPNTASMAGQAAGQADPGFVLQNL